MDERLHYLDRYRDDYKVSEVICVRCGKRWTATRPKDIPLKWIECENCGQGFVIETGERMD